MLRTFQFWLMPNAVQRKALTCILADNWDTYNAALRERRDAWKLQRKSVNYYDQQSQLTELRKDPQFATVAVDIQRDPLRRVDRAFKAFFRRCKAGEKPGYPRFKSRDRYDSFTFGGGNRPVVRERSLKIPNLGDIRIRAGRPIQGQPKTVTIKREGKRWVARVVCDIGPAPEKRVVSKPIGIDLGLNALATLSDGQAIENPRWVRKHEARIAAANRALARKQRRSRNRLRAKEVLRRAHQCARDARTNYLHHASKWLIQNYDLIAHEDLDIAVMAKGRLSKSIMDAAWGQLLFQLRYKAESAGAYVVAVNPRGTSQRCYQCGEWVPKKLWQRTHSCSGCGLKIDRDWNAALNILALAPGRGVVGLPAKASIPN